MGRNTAALDPIERVRRVEQALAVAGAGVAGAQPPPAHLVALAPEACDSRSRGRAQALAREARQGGLRAWVQPAVSLPRAQALAERAGATALSYLEADGTTRWSRGPAGWAPMEETT
ncbi:MAG: hypothetical protein KDK70_27000 [Myxococcales bacterium]|nr:hypothetical protein [Myxococcales bacterium]